MAEGSVDRIVQQAFFPAPEPGRVFVDVGAARPDYLSISHWFRNLGWRVIAIEPNPVFCELHRARGNEILQYACGDRDEDNVEFFVVDSFGAPYEDGRVSYESFSSLGIRDSYLELFNRTNARSSRVLVNMRRLDTILAEHAPEIDRIDVLSVDVEGWELQVVAGLNIAKFRPKVMIIENLFNAERYRSFLGSLGYALWRTLPPNDVFVRESSETTGVRKT